LRLTAPPPADGEGRPLEDIPAWPGRPPRLGDLLSAAGLARPADIEAALAVQASAGGRLGHILVRLGAVSEADLLAVLSRQLGLPAQEAPPPHEAARAFMAETGTCLSWWRERQALAWRADDGSVTCAAVDPQDPTLRDVLETAAAEAPPCLRLISRTMIADSLAELGERHAARGAGASDAARLRELAEETPVVNFVNGVFAEALRRRASDIHFEPFEDRFVVRLRIDGVLQNIRAAPRAEFDAVCSRVKLLSGMDIGERRLPQDGRQTVRVAGHDADLRLSTLPAAWGESLVVRLLGKSSRLPELAELGLGDGDAERLSALVAQPHGVVLITGPTGSGKTTTIYRLLAGLNDGQRKIVTVEDPVEFDLPGVVQMRVRAEIGLSFAAGLRSILRQDPDVIMVGEIRDPETARIAVQAALTGHLVIATAHTNSALAAVSRLLDLGVEDYLLADVLRGLVGQRLVRRLCEACAEPSGQGDGWREPRGCPRCDGTGFDGRLGLFEIIPVTSEVAGMIRRRAGEEALAQAVRQAGAASMLEDGLAKARAGRTPLSEVRRVVGAGGVAP